MKWCLVPRKCCAGHSLWPDVSWPQAQISVFVFLWKSHSKYAKECEDKKKTK